MRRIRTLAKSEGANSLIRWWKHYHPLRVYFNYWTIKLSQHSPSLRLKNFLLRLTGARIAQGARIGPGVTLDFFNPQLIEIGEGAILGYGSTLLCHEFLVDELRVGPIKIGARALIGAHCTILAGVEVGEGAQVSAMTLVNQDVPAHAFAGGVPVRILKMGIGKTAARKPKPAPKSSRAKTSSR